MSKLIRFGVSLDEQLLESFDAMCERRGCANRSEALRDLIRKALIEDAWDSGQGEAAGTLTLVYDHHKNDVTRKLVNAQHDDHDCIIATLHAHLDHHNCLEVLLLKGDPARIRLLADRLIAIRGVKHGAFSLTTTGQDMV